MKKIYLKEGESLHSEDILFIFDGMDITLAAAKDQIFSLGNTSLEFRFDGQDMCLDGWTIGDLLRVSNENVVLSDEYSFYTECHGDENGRCPSCKHNTDCIPPQHYRLQNHNKYMQVTITIDNMYPSFCSDCRYLKYRDGDDFPVCPIFNVDLAMLKNSDHPIRCKECMDMFPDGGYANTRN